MKMLYFLLLTNIMLLGACAQEVNFKTLPEGPVKHHLIVLAKTKQGIRARGFSGATPAKTEIYCEVGKTRANVMSKNDGSFSVELAEAPHDINIGELTFTIGNKHYQQGYQIRDLTLELKGLTKEAFNTDKEVDALSFYGKSVAIVSSQANLLRSFLVDEYFRLSETPTNAVLLASSDNVSLFPNAVSARDDHIAVGLNLSHEVALISTKHNAILSRSKAKDDQGKTFRFNLPTPLTVMTPLDAEESGIPKTVLTASIARNPEGIIALDATHFLVSFSNYYQFEDTRKGQKSVVGPGVVAIMVIENDTLKTKAREILPYKNPRHFVVKDNETLWVVGTGAWSNIGKSNLTSSDAGLVRLKIAPDHNSLNIEHKIPLTNFAPAMPALVNGKLIIPHYENNEIAVIDENATTLQDSDRKKPNFHRALGFTFAVHWHDDVVFLGDKTGSLVAYGLTEGYFPFPFLEPVIIDKHVDERVGLRPTMIFFRHKVMNVDLTTSYPPGFSAWVLSDSHQKIYPMDFLEVFGP